MEMNALLSRDLSAPLSSVPESHRNPSKKPTKLVTVGGGGAGTSESGSCGVLIQTPRRRNAKPEPITSPCTECGKKFWSWKALFGHMRCHPERQWRGINPPANLQRQWVGAGDGPAVVEEEGEFSLTEEDHEAAMWLLRMANGPSADQSPSVTTTTTAQPPSENVSGVDSREENVVGPSTSAGGRFECSSCKRVFSSHQALGGHRASHKNVKGCYANAVAKHDGENETGGGGVAKAEEPPSLVGVFDLNLDPDGGSPRSVGGGITLDLRLRLGL